MMTGKLGTLTMGQAPRSDIVPLLDLHLPAAAACIHAGVLDGLSPGEIREQFAPRQNEAAIVSRLLSGEEVMLGRSAVGEVLQQKIDRLEEQGCDVILILCTGRFADLKCKSAWLIEPDRVVPPVVAALAGNRQVGIIVPMPDQIDHGYEKWASLAVSPICAAASPYAEGGNMEALADAARTLQRYGAEMLILDCMGFVESHRLAVKEASGVPVILSSALLARVTAELF